MIDRYERFSYFLSATSRSLQKLERDEMEKQGLKGACAQYLVALYRSDNGLTASQLCDLCDKDKAAVSRMITELESRGLVFRIGNNNNFYRARVLLTDAGKKAALKVCQLVNSAVMSIGTELTEEQRASFYDCFEILSKRLEELSKNGITQ